MNSKLFFAFILGCTLSACGGAEGDSDTGGQDASSGGQDSGGQSTSSFDPEIVLKVGGEITKGPANFTAKGGDHSVLFVHRSTGKIIWNGGVETEYKALRAGDSISELAGPLERYGDDPSDYKEAWIDGDKLDKISEDVVVFKNCYTSDPTHDLAGRKEIYTALKKRFTESYPNKTFIAWTVPPMTSAEFTKFKGKAGDSILFYEWMLKEWDEPGDNIFVFDYRVLALRGRERFADSDAESAQDSHPSESFAEKIAPCLARRIADVANGEGDSTSRAGGCTVQ